MDLALLLARLVLAAVFAVASLAKLADLPGSRQAMRNFGAPVWLAASLGFLLPVAELAVAIALLPNVSAWWGALGALVLLLLFIAGISANLARGKHPDCHCFGQLHSRPAGWPTLVRNGVLAVVATFILWQGAQDPGKSVVGGLDSLSGIDQVGAIAGLAGLVLLAAAGWAIVHLFNQNRRLVARLDALEPQPMLTREASRPTLQAASEDERPGLSLGSPAPPFALPGLHGETWTLDALCAMGKPVLLVFSDPNCGPCNKLMLDLAGWQQEYAARLTIAVISRGSADANRAKTAKLHLQHLLLQQDREVTETYGANGTPSAVLVRSDGTIGSHVAAGAQSIRALLAATIDGSVPSSAQAYVEDPTPAPSATVAAPDRSDNGTGGGRGWQAPPRVGDPAPPLTLPDAANRLISLAAFRPRPTVVVFWNPGCRACEQMLDTLKAWEANPPPDAPALLVVVEGTPKGDRAMELRSTVIFDPTLNAGRSFGARTVPSAILVDTEGRVASPLVTDPSAVVALLKGNGVPRPTAAVPSSAPSANGAAPTPATPSPRQIGDPAPALTLPDLRGNPVNLADVQGHSTLILFWNPGCGFCARMLDDLRAWEAAPSPQAPRLLMVSTGDRQSNELMGLTSIVVLDQGFTTGRAFGATGTPSAVLVDAAGRIGSPLTVGGPAVLGLLTGQALKSAEIVANGA